MHSIKLQILIVLTILVCLASARPTELVKKNNELMKDDGVQMNQPKRDQLEKSIDQENQSKLNNQLNGHSITQPNYRTNQRTNQLKCTRNTLNSSSLNRSASSSIDLTDCSLMNGEQQLSINKTTTTTALQVAKEVNTDTTKGIAKESNRTVINSSLNEKSPLPHSRPESEQLETLSYENKIDKSSLKNQSNRTLFTPVTISWTRMNVPQYTKQAKCIPIQISNGNYKLRYNGLSVRYYCNEGYLIRGLSRLYCFQGVWTSKIPTCERKSL